MLHAVRQLARVAGALLACHLAQADVQAAELHATAEIRFRGTSTLHDFHGGATADPFTLTLCDQPAPGHPLISAVVEVPVAGMTTDHKKRDRNMFRMLDLPHFATVKGVVTDAPAGEEESVTLQLTIRDRTRDVEATISGWERTEAGLSCALRFPVSLKAFDLTPPSVLGVIRVGDEVAVAVTCEAQFEAKPGDSSSPPPRGS